jgi:hypothetical protein
MKALIKIVSAGKFTQDQKAIMKRVAMVLIEHNLSVSINIKEDNQLQIEYTPKLKVV